MNWDAIGAAGEVVGALGVIFTLGYLAVQIRQNTQSTDKQSRRDAMEFVYTSSRPIIEDPVLAELYLRGMADFHQLSDVEKLRFHYFCTTRIQAATTAIGLMPNESGIADMYEWVNRMMRSQGFRQWWAERGKFVAGSDFQAIGEAMWQEQSEAEQALTFAETYRDKDQ